MELTKRNVHSQTRIEAEGPRYYDAHHFSTAYALVWTTYTWKITLVPYGRGQTDEEILKITHGSDRKGKEAYEMRKGSI